MWCSWATAGGERGRVAAGAVPWPCSGKWGANQGALETARKLGRQLLRATSRVDVNCAQVLTSASLLLGVGHVHYTTPMYTASTCDMHRPDVYRYIHSPQLRPPSTLAAPAVPQPSRVMARHTVVVVLQVPHVHIHSLLMPLPKKAATAGPRGPRCAVAARY